MESTEGASGSGVSDARHNQNLLKGDGSGSVRVFSVDKVTVEKIVLESSDGSREVLLTKNETSRKLSLSSETRPNVVKRRKDEAQRSPVNGRFRVSVPEDAFTSRPEAGLRSNIPGGQSKLPVPRCRRSDDDSSRNEENRIKPIRLTKSPSIGSVAIEGPSNAIAKSRRKVPPKVPEKPNKRGHNSSSIGESYAKVEPRGDLSSSREKVAGEIAAEVKRPVERDDVSRPENIGDKRDDDGVSPVEIKRDDGASEAANEDRAVVEQIGERGFESREVTVDKDAQDRLERSQTTIEDLQRNLSTGIRANTAQAYKEKLLDLQANYALRLPIAADASCAERLSRGFDKDFLEKHNLDKHLKIEERRPLETDLDSDGSSEIEGQLKEGTEVKVDTKPTYSEKVTEVEKRWSGEFLGNQLRRNSSGSSRSSYVEEFGSVSSRESIVEDREARLLFDRKRPVTFTERQTSADESKGRASDDILEDTTVSTVDSDSCLEDRIKAVDEDIARAANGVETDGNDDTDGLDRADDECEECARWDEELADSTVLTTTAIVHGNGHPRRESIGDSVVGGSHSDLNAVKSDIEVTEERRSAAVTDDEEFLAERSDNKTTVDSEEDPRGHRGKDGYANLIKEFAMEAGSSKKKEEKQKKKLGFRRLLPAIFSPKDSRKDYKKKEQQKERKRYDERHFARYQQNGNYTRSPDTMNLNEDIKRNVKLDNSLNGSIIEERLDEIKRELFPEQGPITSTPDHFLQTEADSRLLRARAQRSCTTDSSLSSIAPDDRWVDRSGHLGISPDVRKYEQRQRREEQDSRRYGQLERKHSLQEPSPGNRNYYFQRNHGSSGRISAPPSERYLVRPRAIHPVDRPLPEIPQSRVELSSNYENYQDGVEPLCDGYRKDAYDNVDYQSGLYQNDRSGLIHMPQSVPAQVKITRQPIVNQTQRAPLVGRSPKYPSPGSSQKSGDYADSSCTPNSSQKSEFSPSSSKSGEYYLHSPRSSARTSPAERPFDEARERIYENNEAQPAPQPPSRYVDEHVYDETPPCREERPEDTNTPKNSPEKKDNPAYEQGCSPNVQRSPLKSTSCQQPLEDKESAESKREPEKSHGDHPKSPVSIDANMKNEQPLVVSGQAERTCVQSPSKLAGVIIATSPSAGPRARKSQPNDQILIASPKREVVYQSRVPRPLNETRLCDSPVPIADSRECVPGIVPVEARDQYSGSQDPSVSAKSSGQRAVVPSSVFSKGISRPEPIYGHRKQQSPPRVSAPLAPEIKESGQSPAQRTGSYRPAEPCRDVDERVAWVEGRTSIPRDPVQSRNPEAKQMPAGEPGKRTAQSPARESNAPPQEVYQQRQHVVQQRASSVTSASSSEGQRSSPMTHPDKVYVGANSPQREHSIYEQRPRQQQPARQEVAYVQQQQPRQIQEPAQQPRQEPVYVQRLADPTYPQQCYPACGPLSPSKRSDPRWHVDVSSYWSRHRSINRQLEAFYWQQKALEAERKSACVAQTSPRQVAPKINLPEVQEAVWQQLKRLDEEQQRRIFEQNHPMDDGSYETYCRARRSPPSQSFSPNAPDGPCWGNAQRLKMTAKLPLTQAPKGQNQRVLIVRPQQALRDRQEMSMKAMHCRDPAGRDAQRSKSASPHFHRGEIERSSLNATRAKPDAAATSLRKPEAGSQAHEEDSHDGEGRPRPHPIFKRGSLIGGDSVEYGSAGPKRVSFSNQPNVGPDLPAGNWPTKHGTAPEPPTRRHRSEDSTSDTDSVFLHQDRRDQDALYGARGATLPPRSRSDSGCLEQDYDANKPLPPLPRDPFVASRRGNGARNLAYNDVRWSNVEELRRRRRGK